MKHLSKILGVAALIICAATTVSHAAMKIVVDKSDQVMRVYEDSQPMYAWEVSTGVKDSWTPNGTFGIQFLDADHYSSIYGNAPMPYSIFFNGNVAIHGTTSIGELGARASHGCVRLDPAHAKLLFSLVQQSTKVVIIVRS